MNIKFDSPAERKSRRDPQSTEDVHPMTTKQFRQRLKRACPLTYTKRMDLSPVWSKSNPKRPK